MDDMPSDISAKILTIAIAIGAAIVRLVVDTRHITWVAALRAVTVSAFVAYLVGEALTGVDSIGPGAKNALVGVASLLSRELLEGLIELAAQFKKDPKGFINHVRRGKE
ncbi:hypothetical protein [Sansalvadorimonas verongulae]|uniref:hypothetical protein n=1 Tax=Sansalvadorimonas verongulae TaxID=2172824 RepID=UPI0012BBB6E2|nr:hypothetical protein [Sansalvadorimonas verongulae]MTI13375.1 hypothetical protein [Sansalvadorimonas verongulae]